MIHTHCLWRCRVVACIFKAESQTLFMPRCFLCFPPRGIFKYLDQITQSHFLYPKELKLRVGGKRTKPLSIEVLIQSHIYPKELKMSVANIHAASKATGIYRYSGFHSLATYIQCNLFWFFVFNSCQGGQGCIWVLIFCYVAIDCLYWYCFFCVFKSRGKKLKTLDRTAIPRDFKMQMCLLSGL